MIIICTLCVGGIGKCAGMCGDKKDRNALLLIISWFILSPILPISFFLLLISSVSHFKALFISVSFLFSDRKNVPSTGPQLRRGRWPSETHSSWSRCYQKTSSLTTPHECWSCRIFAQAKVLLSTGGIASKLWQGRAEVVQEYLPQALFIIKADCFLFLSTFRKFYVLTHTKKLLIQTCKYTTYAFAASCIYKIYLFSDCNVINFFNTGIAKCRTPDRQTEWWFCLDP